VGDWVTYSDHSSAALRLYVGKGIGFDAVHAAGCLLFALALGPALIRSLSRFATRLHVTWRPAGHVVAGVVILTAVSLGWLAGQPGRVGVGADVSIGVGSARAAGTPAGYLLAGENADGGFGPAPGSPSSQLFSGWAALGLAAAGENPQDVVRGGHGLLDYIRAGVASASDPGSVERTILVVRAAGLSPQSFGGRNLVSALEGSVRRDGSVSDQVNLTAFAVLALRAAGVAPAPATLAWLVRQQDSDGGFNFATRGGSSDVDDTGAALEALAGSGGAAVARASTRAVRFLRGQQDGDGGFGSQAGAGSNAQSTAFAVQGLIAAGVDPSSLRRRGSSPLDYLRGLTAGDGHVRYSRTTDQTPIWVTAEALMALDAKPLPLAPTARRSAPPVHRTTARASAGHGNPTGHAAGPAAPAARARPAASARSGRRAPSGRAVHAPARPASSAPGVNLDQLAVDAGFLTALALAPIGQG
jgi:energy-coupling factor transport system substrate-specific component